MNQQFLISLTSCIAVGATAGYLGTLMMEKRMALVAGPLGHLALPGVALGLMYGFDISLGAFPFIILGIFIIWLLQILTNLPEEALTAIIFASGVAAAFLFLPIEQAEAALVGDITTIGWHAALATLALCAIVFVAIKKIFSSMVLINISEDLAKSENINIKKYNLIYLLAIAIIVALSVKLVGTLLTAALIAMPAASARNMTKSIKNYAALSVCFGILAPVLGLIIFNLTGLPAGILIILSGAIFFIISAILGWALFTRA